MGFTGLFHQVTSLFQCAAAVRDWVAAGMPWWQLKSPTSSHLARQAVTYNDFQLRHCNKVSGLWLLRPESLLTRPL